jgi:hypothetical protein
MFAASLRWVALVEQGDPRYLDQVAALVALGGRGVPWDQMMVAIDRSIVATLQGDFDAAEALLAEVDSLGDHDHQDHAWMRQHLGWALSMLRGRVAEAQGQLGELERAGHPFAGLLSSITAAELGDPGPALRHLAEVDTAGMPHPRAAAGCGCGCWPRRRRSPATRGCATGPGRRWPRTAASGPCRCTAATSAGRSTSGSP